MDTQYTLLEPVMHEIGPECPDVMAVVKDGEASWAVQFENGSVVNLARRTEPARVEMMVHAGTAPKGTREDVLRALMMFNFLSADTGGARMALGAVGDSVYLVRDLAESDITTPALHAEMRALTTVAGKWREFLESAAHGHALPPLPTEALGVQA